MLCSPTLCELILPFVQSTARQICSNSEVLIVSLGSRVLIVSFRYPPHWGKICFLSTPDGENCGLVKNFAITGLVGTDNGENFLDKLLDCGMEKLVDDTTTLLWLNGPLSWFV